MQRKFDSNLGEIFSKSTSLFKDEVYELARLQFGPAFPLRKP